MRRALPLLPPRRPPSLFLTLVLSTLLMSHASPTLAKPVHVPDTLAQRALPCTSCHVAQDRETPGGYVPRIAGKPAGYLLEQMRNFRDGRRQHDGMARLMEHLSDGYLAELAAHFSGLEPAVGQTGTVASNTQQDAATLAANAARAQSWVQRGDPALGVPACNACHGTALLGVAPNVPGLVGLPAAYISAQMGAWRQGLRKAQAPDCMAAVAKALPAQDIPALAAWLATQPVPAKARPSTAAPPRWPLDCGSVPP